MQQLSTGAGRHGIATTGEETHPAAAKQQIEQGPP